MNAPTKAVFLSYASQDAEAARRICDALRAAGVEVWFDQSELRGGDAWDASIRRQIKECALFVPVISTNTQAREEGYFRREWNLAVNRTLDMADDKAFLLPVVIDATIDLNARVPEKFREVQWTRLPAEEEAVAFVERVQRLLSLGVAPGVPVARQRAVPAPARAGRVLYECGGIRVDPGNRRLSRNGNEVALEPKAFAVLLVLLDRAGEMITRDELLDAVWGHRYVTPATLNRVMSMLRRAFDDDADNPRFIGTVHGSGYRFIGAVERIAAPRSDARANFGPPPIAQLPATLDALIGREHDLAQLRAMVKAYRGVTIIGPGGMGKTQCALEVARQCEGDFPDGIWFFDLSPLDEAHDWIKALAAMLSLPTARSADPLARVGEALAGRSALLLLDNCDRIAREIGALAFELLSRCPELKVLATSRQRLDFTGERLMWLPRLELPPSAAEAQQSPLEQIASAPAVVLLLERARAVQPAISLGRNNVGDIVEICHRLDGMPLALELVAGQFAMLSPGAIRERLQQRFRLPGSDSAGRPRRHQTLHALVDWSYGLLSTQEQRLLCWLGVFQQGWTIEAAEAFGGALRVDPQTLLELHSALIFKSLVVADPTLSPARYRLLETVREFALDRLHKRGEEADARNAHLHYFVQLAERSHREILEFRADEWLQRMPHEHANIDAALTWAGSEGGDPQSALRLAGSLMLYGKCHGLTSQLAGWIERALDGVVPEPSPTYVRAALCSGMLKNYMQDADAERRLNEVIALARKIGDRWAETSANAFLAMWLAHVGRPEQSEECARYAADSAEAQADDWLRSLAGTAQAWIATRANDPRRAVSVLQPLRGVGFDLHQHMMIDVYLALSQYVLGNVSESANIMLDLFAAAMRTRNSRVYAAILEIGAYLAVDAQNPDAGARLLGKAADIRRRTRTPLFSAWIAYHDKATALAHERLGAGTFHATCAAGTKARDEIVIEEARALLRQMAETTAGQAPLLA